MLAVNFKLILASLFLGRESDPGSSLLTRLDHLAAPARVRSGALVVGRQIFIVRPSLSALGIRSCGPYQWADRTTFSAVGFLIQPPPIDLSAAIHFASGGACVVLVT